MTKALKAKMETAVEAIKAIHGDTSGPARDNLDAIREIIGEARSLETALENDCEEPD